MPPPKHVSVFFLNINSVIPKSTELSLFASSHNLSIILIAESKLEPNTAPPDIHYFTPHSSPRSRYQGGLLAYFHESLPFRFLPQSSLLPHNHENHVCTYEIQPAKHPPIFISLVYRHPKSSSHQDHALYNHLSSLTRTLQHHFIIGDFNASHSSYSLVPDSAGARTHNFTISHSLINLNVTHAHLQPTRPSSRKTIDLALTASPHLVRSLAIATPQSHQFLPSSDHHGLLLSLDLSPPLWNTVSNLPYTLSPTKTQLSLFSQLVEREVSEITTQLPNLLSLPPQQLLDRIWSLLSSCLIRCACICFPRSSHNHPPRRNQLPAQLLKVWKDFRKAKSKYFRNKSNILAKANYQHRKKEFRDLLRQHEAQTKLHRFNTALTNNNIFSLLRPPPSPSLPISSPSGSLPSSATEALNNLANFYRPIFQADPTSSFFDEHITNLAYDILSSPSRAPSNFFSYSDLSNAIQRLRPSSPGPDLIHSSLLKHSPTTFRVLLTFLFNMSIRFGTIPADWKQARSFPLPKDKEKTDPSCYRIISITSVVSRLMERLVGNSIISLLERSNFFHRLQAGFRKHYSTNDNIYVLLQHIQLRLRKYKPLPSIFLDLTRAFDTVWHDALIVKLHKAGIPLFLVVWIHSFLSHRSMFITFGGFLSYSFEISRGVPQGCCLSPLLFLIYINDLAAYLPDSVICFLFADDICIIPSDTNQHTSLQSYHDTLLSALSRCDYWFTMWKLKTNAKKSGVLLFYNNKALPPFPPLSLQQQLLPMVDNYKYLGLILSHDLSWHTHITSLTDKCNRTANAISRLFSPRLPPQPYAVIHLIKSLLLPKLSYGLIFTSYRDRQIDDLHSILVSPLKRCLGLPLATPTLTLMCDAGLPHLHALRYASLLFYKRRLETELDPSHPALVSFELQCGRYELESDNLAPFLATLHHKYRLFPRLDLSPNSSLFSVANVVTQHIVFTSSSSSCTNYASRFPDRHPSCEQYLKKDTASTASLRLRLRLIPDHPLANQPYPNSLCPLCHSVCANASEHTILNCNSLKDARDAACAQLSRLLAPVHISLLHAILGYLPSSLQLSKNTTRSILRISATFLEELYDPSFFPVDD